MKNVNLLPGEESCFPGKSFDDEAITKKKKNTCPRGISLSRTQTNSSYLVLPPARYRTKIQPRGDLELSVLAHFERNVTLRAQNYSTRSNDRSDSRDFQGESASAVKTWISTVRYPTDAPGGVTTLRYFQTCVYVRSASARQFCDICHRTGYNTHNRWHY